MDYLQLFLLKIYDIIIISLVNIEHTPQDGRNLQYSILVLMGGKY